MDTDQQAVVHSQPSNWAPLHSATQGMELIGACHHLERGDWSSAALTLPSLCSTSRALPSLLSSALPLTSPPLALPSLCSTSLALPCFLKASACALPSLLSPSPLALPSRCSASLAPPLALSSLLIGDRRPLLIGLPRPLFIGLLLSSETGLERHRQGETYAQRVS